MKFHSAWYNRSKHDKFYWCIGLVIDNKGLILSLFIWELEVGW